MKMRSKIFRWSIILSGIFGATVVGVPVLFACGMAVAFVLSLLLDD